MSLNVNPQRNAVDELVFLLRRSNMESLYKLPQLSQEVEFVLNHTPIHFWGVSQGESRSANQAVQVLMVSRHQRPKIIIPEKNYEVVGGLGYRPPHLRGERESFSYGLYCAVLIRKATDQEKCELGIFQPHIKTMQILLPVEVSEKKVVFRESSFAVTFPA